MAETQYGQRAVLFFGGIIMPMVGVFGYARTGAVWFSVWTMIATSVFCVRLAIDLVFHARHERSGRPTMWLRLALAGAWINGVLCGAAAAFAIRNADPLTQMLIVTLLTAFVMGTAVRNAPFPPSAIGSVVLAEAPMIIACLMTGNVYLIVFAFFIIAFVFSAFTVVRNLYTQNVRFLLAEEHNAELLAQLSAAASTDGLTGVFNRRHFDEVLAKELLRAQRDGGELAAMMLDIDAFKLYNDQYGHQAGDACLIAVARALETCVRRPTDLLARYGGEEFVVLLPATDCDGATAVAEDIRATVEALALEDVASEAGIVTLSIGVAAVAGSLEGDGIALIKRADGALYDAKRGGRNRVRVARLQRVDRAPQDVARGLPVAR